MRMEEQNEQPKKVMNNLQLDIIEQLTDNKHYAVKELAILFKKERSTIQKSITSLLKLNLVECKKELLPVGYRNVYCLSNDKKEVLK
jgi:predicted transcriptional regulator